MIGRAFGVDRQARAHVGNRRLHSNVAFLWHVWSHWTAAHNRLQPRCSMNFRFSGSKRVTNGLHTRGSAYVADSANFLFHVTPHLNCQHAHIPNICHAHTSQVRVHERPPCDNIHLLPRIALLQCASIGLSSSCSSSHAHQAPSRADSRRSHLAL